LPPPTQLAFSLFFFTSSLVGPGPVKGSINYSGPYFTIIYNNQARPDFNLNILWVLTLVFLQFLPLLLFFISSLIIFNFSPQSQKQTLNFKAQPHQAFPHLEHFTFGIDIHPPIYY